MDKCKLCGQPMHWHRVNKPQHQFIPPDGDLSRLNDKKEAPKVTPKSQGDPALRIALMRAGIITPSQLKEAEDDLHSGNPVVILVEQPDLSDGARSSGSDQGDRD